jgi:hypothetical protein
MSKGMVGREYTWAGRRWRVIERWRAPQQGEPYTFVATCCGHAVSTAVISDPRTFDDYLGEDSYCGSCGAQWTESRPAGHVCLDGWQPGGRPVMRNVLIEDTQTGERVVRPFRGLRKPMLKAGVVDRKISALGWELRTHMALCRTVRLTLSERCDGVLLNSEGHRILEGQVTSVAATNAYAVLQGRHIPLEDIRGVKRPHHTDAPASDPRDPLDDERATPGRILGGDKEEDHGARTGSG